MIVYPFVTDAAQLISQDSEYSNIITDYILYNMYVSIRN